MQSCGATGSWCASAIVAIFFASEMPPHHEMSSMAMPTAPRSNASRKPQRVAIVSLSVTGTWVPAAKVAGIQVVGAQRVLVPVGLKLLQRPRDAPRRGQVPQPVQLDHDVHLEPDRRADLRKGSSARSRSPAEMSWPPLASA